MSILRECFSKATTNRAIDINTVLCFTYECYAYSLLLTAAAMTGALSACYAGGKDGRDFFVFSGGGFGGRGGGSSSLSGWTILRYKGDGGEVKKKAFLKSPHGNPQVVSTTRKGIG